MIGRESFVAHSRGNTHWMTPSRNYITIILWWERESVNEEERTRKKERERVKERKSKYRERNQGRSRLCVIDSDCVKEKKNKKKRVKQEGWGCIFATVRTGKGRKYARGKLEIAEEDYWATRDKVRTKKKTRVDDFVEGTRYIVSLVFPSRSLIFLFPFTSVQSKRFYVVTRNLHIFNMILIGAYPKALASTRGDTLHTNTKMTFIPRIRIYVPCNIRDKVYTVSRNEM